MNDLKASATASSASLGVMRIRLETWTLLFALCSVAAAKEATYYTYDGRGNNLIHDNWGSVGELFLRKQVPAAAGYGDTGDMSFAFAKSPREISLGLTLPAHRHRQRNVQHKTDMLTYIGQFFNHDIDLRAEGTDDGTNRIDVEIAQCDKRFNKEKCDDVNADSTSFSMIRSEGQVAEGTRQQINTITAYLDGSVVYGSDDLTADKLRARHGGKMLTFNGELPKNTIGVTMANPAGREDDSELRAAGDVRANVNPVLLAIQSLFIREHNRLAEEISQEHPDWKDAEIYQEARKWNVAYMQSICYYEYIPLLGIQLTPYTGYKSTVNPGIDNFFATVSYRYGHSEVNDVIARVDDDGKNIDDDYITLTDAFFFPTYSLSAGIEPLLRGASFMRQAEVSPHFASSLQNYLFGVPAFGGADLLAINLQRGRDHGMPSYNEARSALGLVRAKDFSDITSDVYLQRQLKDVYETVDNVEPYVGGCAEDLYKESNFGELFYASMAEQYERIRDGDRFYFENEKNGLFTVEEIDDIRRTGLALQLIDGVVVRPFAGLRDIILRNTHIQTLPQNIYVSNPDEPWPLRRLETSVPETVAPVDTVVATNKASQELRSGVYDMAWELDIMNGEEYLKFTLTCQTDGWVGIGIAKDASSAMVGADIVIARFEAGNAVVGDYWADTFAAPVLDTSLGGTNDVELISGSHVNGATTIEFRRRVETADTFDRAISRAGETPVIFAWHSTSHDLEYHTVLRRGKASVDFFAPFTTVPASPASTSPSPATDGQATEPVGGSIVIDQTKNLRFTWKTVTINDVESLDAKMTMKSTASRPLSAQRNAFSPLVDGPAWMGIAVEGSQGGLNKADFFKVSANSLGSCSVRDYWAESPEDISLDTSLGGNDDAISSFCYVAGGYLDFEFKRPIDTGDNFDWPFLKNGYTNVLFLYDDGTTVVDPTTMQEKRYRLDVHSGTWMQLAEVTQATPTPTTTPSAPSTTGDAGGTPTPTEPTPTVSAPVSTTGEVTLVDSGDFVLKYELFKDEIAFEMCFKGQGFGAIGIPGASLNMMDADVFAAVADGSGGCTVGDYWSTGFVAPTEDSANGGTDDLMDATCTIDGEMMTANFKRMLKTGDSSSDRDIDPANIPIIYAFSSTAGGLQYHGPTGRGKTDILPDLSVFEESTTVEPSQPAPSGSTPAAVEGGVFLAGGAASKDIGAIGDKRTLFLAHVWLSGTGLGLFGVAAALIERIGRGWKTWRKAHVSSQILSTLLVFVGELVAIAQAEGHVEYAHCVLAYLLFFLSPPQALLSVYTYRKDRWVPGWKKLNRVVDYFIYALGFFQVWAALRLLNASVTAFQLFYAFTVSVIAILLFVPRSSDKAKQLPVTATERRQEAEQEEMSFAKSFTDKVASKSQAHATPSQSTPSFGQRKSSLIKATSRKSDVTIPAYSPASTSSVPANDGSGLMRMTPEEFQERVTNGKNWTVINDKIYEMEKFQRTHPGGQENIEDIIGKDGTDLYMEAHETSDSAHRTLTKYLIGTLDLSSS